MAHLEGIIVNKRPKIMKRRLLYFIACMTLLVLNAWIMNLAQAQDDSEIIDADSTYFSDDVTSTNAISYDEDGNMINSAPMAVNEELNRLEPMNNNLSEIEDEGDAVEMSSTANSDSEIISGSAPLYNQN
jgi:hypothetical protein